MTHWSGSLLGFLPMSRIELKKKNKYQKIKHTHTQCITGVVCVLYLCVCVCVLGSSDGLPGRMQHNHLARSPAHCIAIKQPLIKHAHKHTHTGASRTRPFAWLASGKTRHKSNTRVVSVCVCVGCSDEACLAFQFKHCRK